MAHDEVTTMGRIRFGAPDPHGMPTDLFGFFLVASGAGRHIDGPVVIATSTEFFEAEQFRLMSVSADSTRHTATYAVGGTSLILETTWEWDECSGVAVRRDTLRNAGTTSVTIHRFLARVSLPKDRYEVYAQRGVWAGESQGGWVPLHTGALELGCEDGRTTQGSSPFAAIRPCGSDQGVVLHLLPVGNWRIRIAARPAGQGDPHAVIEAGIADDFLRASLAPGEALTGPELVFAELKQGRPERSAEPFHRWLRNRYFSAAKTSAPVIFNTWLDLFDYLDAARLRERLPLLKDLGVDVLEVDAGWYGRGGVNDWHASVGDWTENLSRSFFGNMRAFVDEVRAAGLGFGLFMEPESAGTESTVRIEHPQWFAGGGARFDLNQVEARAWMKAAIVRLIQTYGLEWLRLDLNAPLGWDESGRELQGYYDALYVLFDEVRAEHPEVFLEQCASGGMRYDVNTARRGDGYYLSDTQNPVDMIRVSEGILLRLLPGRSTRMIVLRSLGKGFPGHPVDPENMPDTLVTTPAAGWQPAQYPESYDLDFVAIVAMLGVLGVSGDPASLSPEMQSRLKQHIAFYRTIQSRVMSSTATLLTEARPIDDRHGWSVSQYHAPDGSHLVFAFRLQDATARRRFPLTGLEADQHYRIQVYPDGSGGATGLGYDLMNSGLAIDLPKPASAKVIVLEPVREVPE